MSLPLATAGTLAALAGIAAAVSTPWRRSALWFALASLGQGAALSMIDAGTGTHYQHYAPLPVLAANHPALLAVLVVQTAIVLWAWIDRLRTGAVPSTHWKRIAVAAVLSTITAATVSPDVRRYVTELAVAIAVQLVSIATVALIALDAPPLKERRARSREQPEDDLPDDRVQIDRQSWIAAGTAVVLAAVLSFFAYERLPHVPDEVAYLHHAKYLAEGMLTMPAPPVPAAFELDLMDNQPGRWFSPVPPGWPFALAVGAAAGVPWLVNPVLAGLNVLLAHVLIAQIYSRRIARRTAVLLALSPWFLFLGMSYMPHQITLFFTLVAAVGIVLARRSADSAAWAFVAGAGVGGVSLVRPLDGVIVGALMALWALGFGGRRLRLGQLAMLGLGTALVGAAVFPYNRMLTGDPLIFPINGYLDKHHPPGANAYGFGPDRGMGWATDPNPGHSPVDGVINANLNTFAINTDLFGWITGSLVFVAWLLCSRAWRRQDSLMAAAVVAFPLAYFPYYFSGGPDFGARYWFPAIVPLVALTVRGMQAVAESAGTRVWLAAAALTAMTLVTYLPWRAADKYHNYRGMRADLRAIADSRAFGADLVLVRGQRFPDYASAFERNPVDLHARTAIYAWDRDAETRAAVLREYRDRRVWVVDGPSITGRGFEVSSGPVAALDLLREIK